MTSALPLPLILPPTLPFKSDPKTSAMPTQQREAMAEPAFIQSTGSRAAENRSRQTRSVAAHLNQRRYLAVHLPKLASDRILRKRQGADHRRRTGYAKPSDEQVPLVLTEKINNAWRLVHLCERAERLGLTGGMALADAKAAFPGLEVIENDAQKNALLLEAIADWCDRYTPLVAIDKSLPHHYGLTLDITGCAHLFGGEKALMDDLLARLYHQGFCAHGAIAPTPGAAWAFSRFETRVEQTTGQAKGGEATAIFTDAQVEPALAPLPLAALRLTADCVNALARLGLRTVGQLKTRPRAPLARRFGREPLLRLDQALGSIDEAISPRRAVPELMAERRFGEPLVLESDIEAATMRLAGHLTEDLEKRGQGARQVQLALYRVDGKAFHLSAGTSRPERDPAILTRLFKERLAGLQEEFDAGYGFETIRLSALSCEVLKQVESEFITGEHDAFHRRKLAEDLIDRLVARLGADRVLRGRSADTHLPEEAESREPVHLSPSARERPDAEIMPDLPRPLRLFDTPEPVEAVAEVPEGPPIRFRWRKVLHKVVRVEGPERIADHWWGRESVRHTRDYFRIEDETGRRYWLFREGLYGRETNAPRWFMHGLFA